MERIKQAGRQLQWVVLFLLVLSPVIYTGFMYWQGAALLLHLPEGIKLDIDQAGVLEQTVIYLIPAITPAIYWWALYFIYRLSRQYSVGQVFSAGAIKLLRKIGILLMLTDFAYMFQIAITGPLLASFGVTESFLHIELKLGESIIGLFILLISRVMLFATELSDQQRLTI